MARDGTGRKIARSVTSCAECLAWGLTYCPGRLPGLLQLRRPLPRPRRRVRRLPAASCRSRRGTAACAGARPGTTAPRRPADARSAVVLAPWLPRVRHHQLFFAGMDQQARRAEGAAPPLRREGPPAQAAATGGRPARHRRHPAGAVRCPRPPGTTARCGSTCGRGTRAGQSVAGLGLAPGPLAGRDPRLAARHPAWHAAGPGHAAVRPPRRRGHRRVRRARGRPPAQHQQPQRHRDPGHDGNRGRGPPGPVRHAGWMPSSTGLAAGLARETRRWAITLHDGGPAHPGTLPRTPHTAYLRAARSALLAWSARHDHLREITRDDVLAYLADLYGDERRVGGQRAAVAVHLGEEDRRDLPQPGDPDQARQARTPGLAAADRRATRRRGRRGEHSAGAPVPGPGRRARGQAGRDPGAAARRRRPRQRTAAPGRQPTGRWAS